MLPTRLLCKPISRVRFDGRRFVNGYERFDDAYWNDEKGEHATSGNKAVDSD